MGASEPAGSTVWPSQPSRVPAPLAMPRPHAAAAFGTAGGPRAFNLDTKTELFREAATCAMPLEISTDLNDTLVDDLGRLQE